MKTPLLSILAAASLAACAPTVTVHNKNNPETPLQTKQEAEAAPAPTDYRAQAEQFLKGYNEEYVRLYTASAEAEWQSNTRIVPGDTANAGATTRANQRMAAFTGSAENIKKLRELLEHKADLTELQTKQLETALYNAANNPQTVAEVVKRRIAAEAAQTEKLFTASTTNTLASPSPPTTSTSCSAKKPTRRSAKPCGKPAKPLAPP
jgi:peptidyl-dipeptidase A